MTDLATWLLEQIDADEQEAKKVASFRGRPVHVGYTDEDGCMEFADWDPARMLAECDAKRRIAALDICMACDIENDPCGHREDTLRLLVLPYASRPGYRDEWRPSD